MRIKVDVWSKGLDESIREEIRGHVRELFYQLPARRVWFYLKHYRHLEEDESGGSAGSDLDTDNLIEGPEDIIANGKASSYHAPFIFSLFLTLLIACQLFRTKDLCRLMCLATLNHIFLTKNPGFDLAGDISLDENGIRRLLKVKLLAFGIQGGPFSLTYILHCCKS